MFFFIGGVQPKTVTLDQTPRLCAACGLAQARLKRVDQYLSLFFIPLIPVKRGTPMVVCDRCGAASSPDRPLGATADRRPQDRCSRCGYPVEAEFQYCPHCGSRI